MPVQWRTRKTLPDRCQGAHPAVRRPIRWSARYSGQGDTERDLAAL